MTSISARILKSLTHTLEGRSVASCFKGKKHLHSGYSGAQKADIAIVDLRNKNSVLRVAVPCSPVIKIAISQVL